MVVASCRLEYFNDGTKWCEFTAKFMTIRPTIFGAIKIGTMPSGIPRYMAVVGEQEDPFNPSMYIVPDMEFEYIEGDGITEETFNLLIPSLQATIDGTFGPNGHRGIYYFSQFSWGGTYVYTCQNADYEFDNYQDYIDAFDNGELQPHSDNNMRWDVYINGTRDSAITAIPTYASGTGLSTLLLEPVFWTAVDDATAVQQQPFKWDTQKQIEVVDESLWGVSHGVYVPLLENHTVQYLSISEQAASGLSNIAKIQKFGMDGITDAVKLVLQFMYNGDVESYGDAYLVEIPRDVSSVSDVTVTKWPSTRYNDPDFFSEVVIHLGAPPDFVDPDSDSFPGGKDSTGDDDGVYTDPSTNPDFTPYEGQGFSGNCVLTKTYKMTESVLQNIGTKLWTQSYFDVLKIQSNPIENIVSVKCMPFEPTGGSAANVVVGDVDFLIQGDKIPCCEKKTIGTYKYNGYHGNFLDFSPYTIIKAYLPYCGLIQLDASAIYKRTLSFDYAIDYVTGECMCLIEADGMPFMEVKGHMGVDITLTASNCVQSQIKAASAAVNTGAQTAGHLLSGDVGGAAISAASGALNIAGMDYQTQRSGAPSPLCSTYASHAITVLVEHPLPSGATPSDGYKHLHGYPCHKYTQLKTLHGFVQVDTRSDISNISMTEEERKMLEELLIEGVYIWTAQEQQAWRAQYG